MTTKVTIAEATDDQLKAFAKDFQQIESIPAARGGVIAALMESGWTNDFVYVAGEAAAPVQAEQTAPVAQVARAGEKPAPMPTSGFSYWKDSPMVTLRIMPTDRPGGNEPAHPIINGSPALVIQRNKLVEVPWDFYLVIKQAGGTKLMPGADAKDDLVPQDYSEYPMTDVVLPSQAAVDAWIAKTQGHELGSPKAVAA